MQIKINITNKKAKAEENYKIVCGNSDYTILFSFDGEWQPYEKKTARFNFTQDGAKKYIDVLFSGNECPMPILSKTSLVEIGVYAGQLQTTTPCILLCEKSILCDGGMQTDPPEDVYSQLLNSMKEPYIGENNNWFVWDIETKSFVDTGVKATADYSAVEKVNKDLQQHKEESKICATASSNTPIYDVNIKAENKGIKAIKFYGAVSQEQGATLTNPKKLDYPNCVDSFYVCNRQTFLDSYTIGPFLATNKYKDEGWYDLDTKDLHFKYRIKKIILDGTEKWFKVSAQEGMYFVNLHTISGAFNPEDVDRVSNGTPIAYDDGMCSGGTYYSRTNGNPTKSGQFYLHQGSGNSGGFFRAYFYAPEYETLAEVLEAVRKKPLTLLIPMIYDVEELTISKRNEILKALNYNAKNPFSLYFYGNGFKLDTEVTYQLDVGLAIQNLKNAIIALGGNV